MTSPDPPPDDPPLEMPVIDNIVSFKKFDQKRKEEEAKKKQKFAGFRELNLIGKTPKASGHNTRVALRLLGVTCRYDTFHDKMLVAYGNHSGELSDGISLTLRENISDRWEFEPSAQTIWDALCQLGFKNKFNPVTDYFDEVQAKWDGKKRLETWVIDYLGCPDTELNRAIGLISLIAAVRRARQPGCKFDEIIVLMGKEGKEKSTAIEVLAGKENFSDQTIIGLSDQKQQENVAGVLMYEIADLTGLRKAEVEKVKAFASRKYDRSRKAYGRARVDEPRKCVLWATTNDSVFLTSQTGNRRFWPLETSTIDITALTKDRDQLWAEAAREEAIIEASIRLPRKLWEAAGIAQERRLLAHPWEDKLKEVCGTETVTNKDGVAEERIASLGILTSTLQISPKDQTSAQAQTVAQIMARLGWEGPDQMKIGGKNVRGYRRPSVETKREPPEPEPKLAPF